MFKSLKVNPSDIERHLEQVNAALRDYQADFLKLVDANKCPPELLPFLAWLLSVDYWREDWSEATKRQVCKDSIAIHQQKGTLSAIKKALQSVGVVADITEPFADAELAPHQFRIDADLDKQLVFFDEKLAPLMRSIMHNVKPARSYYSFYLHINSELNIGFGAVADMRQVLNKNTALEQPPRAPMPINYYVGFGGAAMQIQQAKFIAS